jgi:hypothetical protein
MTEEPTALDIMTLQGFLMMEIGRRRARYPDALMDSTHAARLISSANLRRQHDASFSPATHICDDMLSSANSHASNFDFTMRRLAENKGRNNAEDEVQGFVDGALLFASAAAWKVSGPLPPPAFWQLPEPCRVAALNALKLHQQWSMRTIHIRDLRDGANFMNGLVKRVQGTRASDEYRRGVRTARDTLLLSADLLIDVFEGKLRQAVDLVACAWISEHIGRGESQE